MKTHDLDKGLLLLNNNSFVMSQKALLNYAHISSNKITVMHV